MKKEAFRKLIRALRWPAKSRTIVSSLSRMQSQKAHLEEALKHLNRLAQAGKVTPEQYGVMSDQLGQQFDKLTKVTGRLMKYKTLGDADRKVISDTGKGILLSGLGLAGVGYGLKDIYDKEKRTLDYVDPVQGVQLEREYDELQDSLDNRKQYGSWWS